MPWRNFHYPHWLNQNRLSERHMLQPLFEAVENAFNSIEESGRTDGSVRIVIHRDLQQKTMRFDESGKRIGVPSAPISIEVIDNGIGFTEENWTAFETIFTPHKENRGGKGMGRLTYLLAFQEADFESCYKEGGKGWRRRFSLKRINVGTSTAKPIEDDSFSDSSTIVRFNRIDQRFVEKFPKRLETIAGRLVVHFFRRLSRDDGPVCTLTDDWDDSQIDLRRFCRENFILEQRSEPIEILARPYTVTHVRAQRRVVDRHEVLFCGNGRVVCSKELPSTYSITRDPLKVNGDEFFYAAFLESPVLDKATRTDRLSLALDEDDSNRLPDPDAGDSPSIQKLVAEVGERAREFLKDVLDPLEAGHKNRIEEYCKHNVVFRPLLKHKMDALLKIPVGLPDDDFAQAISRVYHIWKADIRSRFQKMAKTVRENTDELQVYREGYQEILRDLSELAFHELAGYVIDRKAVVDFLWSKLAASPNGKFSAEDQIHDIFFPRRVTSEDVAWDESNLWLIDERLAYQQFVASDVELELQGLAGSTSQDRPDLAIYYDRFYDLTFAFAEGDIPFSSVMLIEFKRPERTKYTEKENPVAQVMRYIREIRDKKALTNDRHTFRIPDHAPIHVHVICHIVDELRPYLDQFQYIETPDGQGIVFHAPKLNTMIQFTSFEKLVADARKRNDVFFRKLGIDEAGA